MKLVDVILGRSMRLMKVVSPAVYIPDSVRAVQERYRFLQGPKTLEEFDASKGISFQHGTFTLPKSYLSKEKSRDHVVIDRFQVYTNGLLVETRGFTEEGDLFLDDVIQWASQQFAVAIYPGVPVTRAYLTNLEIEFPDAEFPSFPFTKTLDAFLKSYGQPSGAFSAVGFNFHCDFLQMPPPVPSAFQISRREGVPYTSNLYLSSAPLSTRDHLTLLEEVSIQLFKKSHRK